MEPTEPILIIPDWPAPVQVQAVSTGRNYGCSEGSFSSFNVGNHVGDKPNTVATNRAALVKTLGLTDQPCWLDQVHSTSVVNLDSYVTCLTLMRMPYVIVYKWELTTKKKALSHI